MGFYYHFDEAGFNISAHDVPAAQEALVAWNNKKHVPLPVRGDGSVFEQLVEPYWLQYDEAGAIVNVGFGEIKGSDESEWLQVVAPWVCDDSYIQIHDDDGEVYRYMFVRGHMYRVDPAWIVPGEKYISLAISATMFPRRCTIAVREVNEAALLDFVHDNAVSVINPSHKTTIDEIQRRYGIDVPVPEKAPQVLLQPGDSVLVIQGTLPRLQEGEMHSPETVKSAPISLAIWTVLPVRE